MQFIPIHNASLRGCAITIAGEANFGSVKENITSFLQHPLLQTFCQFPPMCVGQRLRAVIKKFHSLIVIVAIGLVVHVRKTVSIAVLHVEIFYLKYCISLKSCSGEFISRPCLMWRSLGCVG